MNVRRTVVATVAGIALAACGSDEAPSVRGRGPNGGADEALINESTPPPAAPIPRTEGRRTTISSTPRGAPSIRVGPPPGASATKVKQMGIETIPDMGPELVRAVGNPATCIPPAFRPTGPQMTVQLEVNLTQTGTVTRASAAGGGLPPAALDCLRQRIEAHRFPGGLPTPTMVVRAPLVIGYRAGAPQREVEVNPGEEGYDTANMFPTAPGAPAAR